MFKGIFWWHALIYGLILVALAYANGCGDSSVVTTTTTTLPASGWQKIGGGMDAPVYALIFDDSGVLIAAGSFDEANGIADTRHIARWNGTRWEPLGKGLSGVVNALARDSSGNIYAGGNFTTAHNSDGDVSVSNLARWNGTVWQDVGGGVNGEIYALAFDSAGMLYVGGSFTSAGGNIVSNAAAWDGLAWRNLAGGTDSPVHAVASNSTYRLVAGGSFLNTVSGVNANRIASWNGVSWSDLSSGRSYYINAIAPVTANIFAGGALIDSTTSDKRILSRFDGSSWEQLPVGASDGEMVSSIVADSSGKIYIAGKFAAAGGVTVNGLAAYDGATWEAFGSGLDGNLVRAVALDGSGNIYVGGDFSSAGGVSVSYIAKYIK
ncbi:MAG: hypothetical protein KKF06_05915 [Candidatus Margulisbacteria bacterium]|nr:hypothetical protein [Candidatus Margulisiibacteriota bacterium]